MNINDFNPEEIEVVQEKIPAKLNINDIAEDEIEVVQIPESSRIISAAKDLPVALNQLGSGVLDYMGGAATAVGKAATVPPQELLKAVAPSVFATPQAEANAALMRQDLGVDIDTATGMVKNIMGGTQNLLTGIPPTEEAIQPQMRRELLPADYEMRRAKQTGEIVEAGSSLKQYPGYSEIIDSLAAIPEFSKMSVEELGTIAGAISAGDPEMIKQLSNKPFSTALAPIIGALIPIGIGLKTKRGLEAKPQVKTTKITPEQQAALERYNAELESVKAQETAPKYQAERPKISEEQFEETMAQEIRKKYGLLTPEQQAEAKARKANVEEGMYSEPSPTTIFPYETTMEGNLKPFEGIVEGGRESVRNKNIVNEIRNAGLTTKAEVMNQFKERIPDLTMEDAADLLDLSRGLPLRDRVPNQNPPFSNKQLSKPVNQLFRKESPTATEPPPQNMEQTTEQLVVPPEPAPTVIQQPQIPDARLERVQPEYQQEPRPEMRPQPIDQLFRRERTITQPEAATTPVSEPEGIKPQAIAPTVTQPAPITFRKEAERKIKPEPENKGIIARPAAEVGIKEYEKLPENVWLHGTDIDGEIKNFSVTDTERGVYLTKNWRVAENYTDGDTAKIKAIELKKDANIFDLNDDAQAEKLAKLLKERIDDFADFDIKEFAANLQKADYNQVGLIDNAEIGNVLYEANVDAVIDTKGNAAIINDNALKTYRPEGKGMTATGQPTPEAMLTRTNKTSLLSEEKFWEIVETAKSQDEIRPYAEQVLKNKAAFSSDAQQIAARAMPEIQKEANTRYEQNKKDIMGRYERSKEFVMESIGGETPLLKKLGYDINGKMYRGVKSEAAINDLFTKKSVMTKTGEGTTNWAPDTYSRYMFDKDTHGGYIIESDATPDNFQTFTKFSNKYYKSKGPIPLENISRIIKIERTKPEVGVNKDTVGHEVIYDRDAGINKIKSVQPAEPMAVKTPEVKGPSNVEIAQQNFNRIMNAQPYELTLEDYIYQKQQKARVYRKPTGQKDRQEMKSRIREVGDQYAPDEHKNAVKRALAEGKPVPPEVLAEYPDLNQPRPKTGPSMFGGAQLQNAYEKVEPTLKKGADLLFKKGKKFVEDESGSLSVGPLVDAAVNMFNKGRKKVTEMREKREYLGNPIEALRTVLFDRFAPAIKPIEKKLGKAEATKAVNTVDRMLYADNLMKEFAKDSGLAENMAKNLQSVGLNIDHFGAYAEARRILYERDPRGLKSRLTKQQAIDLLDEFQPKQRAVLQQTFEELQENWKKTVVPQITGSEVFDPKINNYIENNDNYSRDVVVDYIGTETGKDARYKNLVEHLKGTEKEKLNPVEQMVLYGRAINQFTSREMAKRQLTEMLDKAGEISADPKEGYEPIRYMHKGEWVEKYAPRRIAQSLMDAPRETHDAIKLVDKIFFNNKYAKWMTRQLINNPGFMLGNSLMLDPVTTWAQLPSFKSKIGYPIVHALTMLEKINAPGVARLSKAFGLDTLADVKKKMTKERIYNIGSLYERTTGEETELGDFMKGIGINENALEFFTGKKKWKATKAYNTFEDMVSKVDQSSKESLYRYLKAFEPNLGEEKIATMTREMGTPATKRSGLAEPILRRGTLFGNAILQALRATAKNYKDNPAVFTTSNIGVPAALAYGVYQYMQRDPEARQRWNGLSDYQKKNFVNIYTGQDAKDKPIFLSLPLPRVARVFYGMVVDMLENDKGFAQTVGEAVKGLGKGALSELPSGLSRPVGLAFDVGSYMAGKAPYDYYRDSEIIPDQVMKADATLWNKIVGDNKMNDLSTTKAFGSYLLNTYGIGGWFNMDTMKNVPEGYGALKVAPISRLFRMGGSGIPGKLYEAKEDVQKLEARAKILIQKAVEDSVQNEKPIKFTDELKEALTYAPKTIQSQMEKAYVKKMKGMKGSKAFDLYGALKGATMREKLEILKAFKNLNK